MPQAPRGWGGPCVPGRPCPPQRPGAACLVWRFHTRDGAQTGEAESPVPGVEGRVGARPAACPGGASGGRRTSARLRLRPRPAAQERSVARVAWPPGSGRARPPTRARACYVIHTRRRLRKVPGCEGHRGVSCEAVLGVVGRAWLVAMTARWGADGPALPLSHFRAPSASPETPVPPESPAPR